MYQSLIYMWQTLIFFYDVQFVSNQKYAFPADELMPLSCKGRYRGTEPSRGDVDDSLGK